MSYRAPRETVSGIEVRGLSLSDVSALLRQHRTLIESLFQAYQKGDQDLSSFGETLLLSAPELAASIIGQATDDPRGEWSGLPAGLAVLLLEAIGRLTFDASGGVGKVLEVLVKAVEGTSDVLAPLGSGTTDSDGTPAS